MSAGGVAIFIHTTFLAFRDECLARRTERGRPQKHVVCVSVLTSFSSAEQSKTLGKKKENRRE